MKHRTDISDPALLAVCRLAIVVVPASLTPSVHAAPAAPADFDARVRPFLAAHCVKCHSGDKPKGDFNLDHLPADFANVEHLKQWRLVKERVLSGEMPPKAKPRPPADEAKAFTSWVGDQIVAAETLQRKTEGRVVLRRLNRVEYENTVHDLLGIRVPLKNVLPADASAGGFDNVGEALHTSSFLLDKYLEAANVALDAAICNDPKPPARVTKRFSLAETQHVKSTTERVFRKLDGGGLELFTSSAWQAVVLSQLYAKDRGDYRFRISARAVQSGGKPVTYQVDAGMMYSIGNPAHLVGYFDAPPGKSEVIEFSDYLEAQHSLRILPYGLANAMTVTKVGADQWDGPGLAVDWVEVDGPINDVWPPESHRRIFGDLKQVTSPDRRVRVWVEVVSENPSADAERIIRQFARRAFRRPATDADVKPILALVKRKLADGATFEQAVRVGLAAVLVSPKFLFLQESSGPLDDFALASRLSYFLWSTTPDERLLALAEAGKLREPATLRAQVDRLLNDPRSAAFAENFCGQWLNLRDIEFTVPSHILYPEFDEMLKVSMVKETQLFVAEVLKDDLPLTNFLASDFSMLNGRLAKHYGIAGVDGWAFRKTPLPPESHRGGLLTMASVLKVTANGTNTSPVLRGAWVLDRILGTPAPPPPDDVGSLEPDIRGASTIREQLAKHRRLESCASCHVRIDPPGFALESFDVIGGYREHYRSTGNGKEVKIDGRRMQYLEGQPVDPSAEMPDGRRFENVDEFKRLLLEQKDVFATALTKKLVTYATGAPVQGVDEPTVEAIVAKARGQNYGFRTLVHELVASELFRSK